MYVFFIAILLLNFLIAFMSIAVNEVGTHKEVLTNIQLDISNNKLTIIRAMWFRDLKSLIYLN